MNSFSFQKNDKKCKESILFVETFTEKINDTFLLSNMNENIADSYLKYA